MIKLLYSLTVSIAFLLSGSIKAQNITFSTAFNNSLENSSGESPTNTSGVDFAQGLKAEAILVEAGDILSYAISGNIKSEEGTLTLWVKPNWIPGDVLRRIVVVEGSPVFEMHVDESGSLVFAMFSDQIETRIASASVMDWGIGNWHFLAFTWGSDRVEIYVDGVRLAATDVGFSIPAFQEGEFHVGSSNGVDQFDGLLDELVIYDAPLTEAQINGEYESALSSIPESSAIRITDIFSRDVTDEGIRLVDWEGPVRNPAMKYFLKGNDLFNYPLTLTLSTNIENTSFNLPSTISPNGPVKTIVLDSESDLEFFLFSFYMDKDFEDNEFDLTLKYNLNGLPVRQSIPVTVIDQDRERSLSYPVIVDFSEAVNELMVDPATQDVIIQAAQDWLYYIDGSEIDEIPEGESTLVAGGQDHLFDEKTLSNAVAYTGYYLFAYGNTNAGPCVCSTGGPNREQLQSSNGEVVPIFRVGGLHLNVFGQAFETEPTGWEILSPYENWTVQNENGTPLPGTDIYSLAKHEIGHAMVFENSPLFLLAQGRDPDNPYPDESVIPTPNGFTSPALTDYYPDQVVPLYANSLSHVRDVLDPASQVPPYGGSVPEEVMPGGREMLTKLDILIMESVGYPLRENEVTRSLTLTSESSLYGNLETDFSAVLRAEGGIPFYHYTLSNGSLPAGLSLNSITGEITGIPEEEGEFTVTFKVQDYDERSKGAILEATLRVGIEPLSLADEKNELLTLFPNPADQFITIEISQEVEEWSEIGLFDIKGQLLMHFDHKERIFSIPTNKIPAGLYFIKMTHEVGTKTSTQLMLIQH